MPSCVVRICLDIFSFVVCYSDPQNLADIYYAYNAIHRYLVDPFTGLTNETLFFNARFLNYALGKVRRSSLSDAVTPTTSLFRGLCHAPDRQEVPHEVSRAWVLFALAKQSRNLGAFKVCRTMHNLLLINHNGVPSDHMRLVCVTCRLTSKVARHAYEKLQSLKVGWGSVHHSRTSTLSHYTGTLV